MRTVSPPMPLAVAVAILSVAIHSAFGQEKEAAKLLGQTKESGSLPLWTAPAASAVQELGKHARAVERGVFLVGHPKVGTGTAWVISKKHRLLVTNAHVADMYGMAENQMLAIPSGTSDLYIVDKVWYHPGVRRFLKNNPKLSVRSSNPMEGNIDPHSPDLALLQLSAAGPDLAVEFPLATAEELEQLFAQPAAIMGFPGHDTTGWPALGDKAASTFHEGVISRLTDFEMGTSAPHAELQFVQYTMSTWPGFSGSPVFLPNGRVAAVHNMATPEEGRYKQIITIPHGIRSDCVLEMLVHHGLDGMVPFPFDKSKVQVERWTKVDARSAKAREDYVTASILVDEAEDLIYNKSKYSAGTEKCNEALKVLPSLARAHYVRSVACNSYYVDHGGVSEEEDLRLLGAAHKDAVKYTNMVPSDFLGILQVCRVLNNIGVATQNHENTRKSLTILNEVLTSKQLQPYERATAHSCRGQAVSNLGDKETALREHNEAIRLAPKSSSMLWNRSYYWRGIGRDDLADADVAKAREMDARPAASEAADLEKARKLGQTIVLVESKGKWYKAAIVKAEDARSFIHYIGYAETWDEWVTPDRIRSASK